MKKVSMVSILSVLVLPAFAQTDVKYLYGDTANIQQNITPNADMINVAEPQPDVQQIKEQAVDSKEITEQKVEKSKVEEKRVEEQKAEKQTKKTSKSKEKQKEVQEKQQSNTSKVEKQKFETKYSNPKTKFPHGLQLGIGVSPTSGLNAFIGYNNKKFDSFWWKRFGFRLDFATYSPIKNKLNTEINDVIGDEGLKVSENVKLKDFEINAKHIGAIIDFYPFGDTWFLGGWRVSGGYMSGRLDLSAGFVGYEKGGVKGFCVNDYFYYYSDGQSYGRAFASWKYNGPYLGTGFDFGLIAGLKLYMDAGVVFANTRPDVDVNIPLDGLMRYEDEQEKSVKDDPAVREFFEQNKEAALAEARNEVKDYKYYPMVKMGFMYRF